jgi:hypothetical protein
MASIRRSAAKKSHRPPPYCTETYRQELVRCGRARCRCASGRRADQHGPYWYGYWTDVDGRTRKRYLGKNFDPAVQAQRYWRTRERAWKRREVTNTKRAHSVWSILDKLFEQERRQPPPRPSAPSEVPSDGDYRLVGVTPWVTARELESARRRLALAHHPDRGGDVATMQAINAACDRIARWLEVRVIPGL